MQRHAGADLGLQAQQPVAFHAIDARSFAAIGHSEAAGPADLGRNRLEGRVALGALRGAGEGRKPALRMVEPLTLHIAVVPVMVLGGLLPVINW